MTASVRRRVERSPSQRNAFGAMLRRDIYVTWQNLGLFLMQVVLQPLFVLFVFGYVLRRLGYARPGYADLLFPGLLALTTVITAMQSISFSLTAEFGWTKEIEDRLLAPIAIPLVATEKILFASLRAFVAVAFMIPAGVLILGSIPWRVPLFLAALVLGALLGANLGLVLGTLIPAARVNYVFAFVFTVLLFTGCGQYSWPSLDRLRWFQVVTAANPLTYVSEAMRGATLPSVPHINPLVCVGVLVVSVTLLWVVGVRGFERRAVD
jgi:ABC-2 type transport system permease protein